MDQEPDILAPPEPKPETARWLIGWIGALCGLAIVAAVVLPPKPSGWDYSTGERSRVSRVQADMRTLAVAIESYYIDHSAYPAWAMGKNGVNSGIGPDNPAYRVPTFMARPEGSKLYTLTTPISYMPTYFADPFIPYPRKGFGTYAYWVGGKFNQGWIIYSPGPDHQYDIVPWEDYAPGQQMSDAWIDKTYDATNGSRSRGDIWKVKQ